MATKAERAERLYGTAEAPAPRRILKAGPLSVWLEDGNLRYVSYRGQEVLRAVSYIIRDRDWGTCRTPVMNLVVEEDGDGFRVTYDGVCESPAARLLLRAEILGEPDGRLTFSVEATPDGPFETNRCGFNVLHPLEAAGRPVAVEHVDGTVEKTVFPELIAPWQPFKEIRALTSRPGGLFDAACRLEGDTFEMEDQRNWSDASFKTYVRPIELPWPYELAGGETNRQTVVLEIGDRAATSPAVRTKADDARPVTLRLAGEEPIRLPAIGVIVTPEEVEAVLAASDRLSDLGPRTILCHFDPTIGHGREALRQFSRLQQACPADYSLECVVAANGSLADEFRTVAEAVDAADLMLSSIAVCPSVDRRSTPPGSEWPGCPPLADIYRAARDSFPDIPLGGGMFSYFTELNRKRPPVDLIDFVTHATNPIVHAADDESVMETLTTLPHITRSARAVIGEGKPYRLGPSTIGMRQNPYGSRTMPNPDRRRVCMAAADPRQDGLFAAAWTVGYAAAVASAGLDVLTPSAFVGPRGVLGAGRGAVRPVFHAVKWLAAGAGAALVAAASDDPSVAVLAMRQAGRVTLLVANLSARRRRIRLDGLPAPAHVEILDADDILNSREAEASADLQLDAFAIARLDL